MHMQTHTYIHVCTREDTDTLRKALGRIRSGQNAFSERELKPVIEISCNNWLDQLKGEHSYPTLDYIGPWNLLGFFQDRQDFTLHFSEVN